MKAPPRVRKSDPVVGRGPRAGPDVAQVAVDQARARSPIGTTRSFALALADQDPAAVDVEVDQQERQLVRRIPVE